MNNVLVYAGQVGGELTGSALEALTLGKKLTENLGRNMEVVTAAIQADYSGGCRRL